MSLSSCRVRLFLERLSQIFHQRLQILIETPGDFMPIHPQFNARHNLRLLHITESKTVGDLLFQNLFDLRSSFDAEMLKALWMVTLIAAASDGFAHLNAFFLIELFDPADKFIDNPFLQIGIRQIAQCLARRGI